MSTQEKETEKVNGVEELLKQAVKMSKGEQL